MRWIFFKNVLSSLSLSFLQKEVCPFSLLNYSSGNELDLSKINDRASHTPSVLEEFEFVDEIQYRHRFSWLRPIRKEKIHNKSWQIILYASHFFCEFGEHKHNAPAVSNLRFSHTTSTQKWVMAFQASSGIISLFLEHTSLAQLICKLPLTIFFQCCRWILNIDQPLQQKRSNYWSCVMSLRGSSLYHPLSLGEYWIFLTKSKSTLNYRWCSRSLAPRQFSPWRNSNSYPLSHLYQRSVFITFTSSPVYLYTYYSLASALTIAVKLLFPKFLPYLTSLLLGIPSAFTLPLDSLSNSPDISVELLSPCFSPVSLAVRAWCPTWASLPLPELGHSPAFHPSVLPLLTTYFISEHSHLSLQLQQTTDDHHIF